jgi:WD40 repeat protein
MKFFIISLFIISISACKSDKNKVIPPINENAVSFSSFPTEQTLTFTTVANIPQLKPDGLLLYKDSFLLIRNAVNSSTFHYTIFDIISKKVIGDVLGAGRKPGQALGILSSGIIGNNLWVHDLIKNKINFCNIDSSLAGKPVAGTEFEFTHFYYSIQILPDSQVIATGDYDSPYKIAITRMDENKQLKQILPYPPDSLSGHPRADKMAYESFLFAKPSGDKCVMACRYSDRIELLDIRTGKSQVIKGPENFEPSIVIMKGNDGKELGTRGPESRYAFVKGKTTNKYIYLLYSGNHDDTEHLYFGKYIYVYDWDGKPVKKITLQDYVLDFAVTQNDTELYSYDPVTKNINLSKL